MRILLAEDERDLNRIILRKLTEDGYVVDGCFDGKEALAYLATTDYDAVILDIMMPGKNGLEVLSSLRQAGKSTPVLLLTARDAVSDRVKGLDSGANDYLVKPFSFEELTARLRAMLRSSFGMVSNSITVSDLVMDCSAHTVRRGEKEIVLSAKEYALLEYL
ncbi:MAG TPA: response regulator transcription factor, partial [Clostridiales bacterium]|nr:response regulator transcription factor [Clostridiales bacterium]